MIDIMSKKLQYSRKKSLDDFSRFDALPDSTIATLCQFHQENPNPNKQELRNVAQSLNPPLSEKMISEWFVAANGGTEDSSVSVVDSVEYQLRSLLTGPHFNSLTDIKQVGRFSRIMNKASDNDSDIKRCLQIICNTKSESCLLSFVSSKGMNVMDNWTKIYGLKGDTNSLLVLQTLSVLPFVLQIFQSFPFGKYVKKMSKTGSPDCKRIAENIMEKWTRRTQEQIVNPVKMSEAAANGAGGLNKRPIINGKSVDVKKIKTANKVAAIVPSREVQKKIVVETKKHVSAIGSFDIFSKLSTVATIPATKTKKASPVNPNDALKLLSVFNHEEGAALKKGRGSTPYISRNIDLNEPVSFSYKIGGEGTLYETNSSFKKKKSVKFRPDTNLMDIRYFSMDDTPASINERSSEIPKFVPIYTDMNLVVDLLQPQISWTSLRELMLPNFPIFRVTSRETAKQERREKSVVSFVSLDDNDIPFSPVEPDVEEFVGMTEKAPISWPLNTMIAYGASATSLKTLDIGLLKSYLPQSF